MYENLGNIINICLALDEEFENSMTVEYVAKFDYSVQIIVWCAESRDL